MQQGLGTGENRDRYNHRCLLQISWSKRLYNKIKHKITIVIVLPGDGYPMGMKTHF